MRRRRLRRLVDHLTNQQLRATVQLEYVELTTLIEPSIVDRSLATDQRQPLRDQGRVASSHLSLLGHEREAPGC